MTQKRWRIHLGAEAEKDFARILKYTKDNFGQKQKDIYAALNDPVCGGICFDQC